MWNQTIKIKYLFCIYKYSSRPVNWVATEYVLDLKPKEITTSHQDTKKDRKGVVYARYLSNGMKINIAHAVTTSWELDHLGVGRWEYTEEN
jgi:hypothetical protein